MHNENAAADVGCDGVDQWLIRLRTHHSVMISLINNGLGMVIDWASLRQQLHGFHWYPKLLKVLDLPHLGNPGGSSL